jgi:hypothetical protein
MMTGQVSLRLLTESYLSLQEAIILRDPISQYDYLLLHLRELLDRQSIEEGILQVEVVLERLTPRIPQQLPLFPEMREPDQSLDSLIPLLNRHHSIRAYQISLVERTSLLLERRFQLVKVA